MNKQTVTDPSQQYDLRILGLAPHHALDRPAFAAAVGGEPHHRAPQLMCLRTVIANGPLTATAISREIHVSPSTVVGILDRLEDKGLIRRERGREDRRIVFVTATKPDAHWPGCAVAAAETPGGRAERVAGTGAGHHHAVAERIVALMEQDGHAAAAEPHVDPASPILEVPTGGAPPESGLVV